jgi:MerR family copper efflux transcriptional regulator
MRITEAARRLGTSARMLRYREDLGLLPQVRDRFARSAGPAHRVFTAEDVAAVAAALDLERRYDVSPAALAFGVRVLAEPAVRAAVADLGRRLGRIPAPASRAVDFEKERALRLLSRGLGLAQGPDGGVLDVGVLQGGQAGNVVAGQGGQAGAGQVGAGRSRRPGRRRRGRGFGPGRRAPGGPGSVSAALVRMR